MILAASSGSKPGQIRSSNDDPPKPSPVGTRKQGLTARLRDETSDRDRQPTAASVATCEMSPCEIILMTVCQSAASRLLARSPFVDVVSSAKGWAAPKGRPPPPGGELSRRDIGMAPAQRVGTLGSSMLRRTPSHRTDSESTHAGGPAGGVSRPAPRRPAADRRRRPSRRHRGGRTPRPMPAGPPARGSPSPSAPAAAPRPACRPPPRRDRGRRN